MKTKRILLPVLAAIPVALLCTSCIEDDWDDDYYGTRRGPRYGYYDDYDDGYRAGYEDRRRDERYDRRHDDRRHHGDDRGSARPHIPSGFVRAGSYSAGGAVEAPIPTRNTIKQVLIAATSGSVAVNTMVLREGAKLVILGLPNAGKSSLMNALLGSERAIVTDIPGTTRDTLEEKLNIFGVPVRLVDTAGLRDNAESPVERIGIDRAESEAESAECLLFIFDGAGGEPSSEELALLKKAEGRIAVFAVNKCDISLENCEKYEQALKAERDSRYLSPDTVIISTKTGEGLDALKTLLAKKLGASESRAIVTNSRHIERLCFAKSELKAALAESSTDLISVFISSALAALAEITGREFSEELLDGIFTKFCVGK